MVYKSDPQILECDSPNNKTDIVNPINEMETVTKYVKYLAKDAKDTNVDKRCIKNEKK